MNTRIDAKRLQPMSQILFSIRMELRGRANKTATRILGGLRSCGPIYLPALFFISLSNLVMFARIQNEICESDGRR